MAAGGLIVTKDSNITEDMDLEGKKIGVAGGQVDKGWLIYRAYFQKKYGKDLVKLSKPIFGAPPLLNKKIKQKSFKNYRQLPARLCHIYFFETKCALFNVICKEIEFFKNKSPM